MVTLRNVIDTRDGRYYSVVIVKKSKAKWFVPATEEDIPGGEDQE